MKNIMAFITLAFSMPAFADSVYLCEDGSKVYRSTFPDQVKLLEYKMTLTEKQYDKNNPERVSRYTGKGYDEDTLSEFRKYDHIPYAAFILLNDSQDTYKGHARLVLSSMYIKEDKLKSASNYSCTKL